MAQQIIYQNGIVLQWQDTEQFSYSAPAEGVQVMPVAPEQWAQQQTLRWVRGGALTDIAPEPAAMEPAAVTQFSARDFLRRFTMAEYAAARTSTNIAVQWALDNLIGAQYVDITDPDTVAGLDLMVAEGIIDAAKRADLLTPQAV